MDMIVPLLKPSVRTSKTMEDGGVEQEDGARVNIDTRCERERRRRAIRPELDCQLFKVKHEVRIMLHCSYEDPEASPSAAAEVPPPRKKQTLYATLPVRLVEVLSRDLPTPLSPSSPTTSSSTSSIFTSASPSPITPPPPTSLASLIPSDLPYGDSIVPAYTELFYENGERRDDEWESEWLPAYEPRRADEPETSSLSGSSDDDDGPAI
jgi:hypothetical protein